MKTITYDDKIIITDITIVVPKRIFGKDLEKQILYAIKVAQGIEQCRHWGGIGVIAAICDDEYSGIVRVTGDACSWDVLKDFEHRAQYHDGWSLDE